MNDEATVVNDLLALTAEIVTAHVSHNNVHRGDLPELIKATYAALAALTPEAPAAEPEKPKGAVTARKSLADPTRIISMIDGKGYSSLARHIGRHGYTKESYREAFGLPKDYPMMALAYAARRSELARSFGLGRKKVAAAAETVQEAAAPVVARAKRGARQVAETVADTVAPKARRARKSVADALRSAKEHLPS